MEEPLGTIKNRIHFAPKLLKSSSKRFWSAGFTRFNFINNKQFEKQ